MRGIRMSKEIYIFTVSIAMLLTLGSSVAYANEKVTLCHFLPGNPENPITIVVNESAVSAHLDHGDTLGECPTDFNSCGDGVVQETEGCDHPDFGEATCEDVLGAGATGTPACTEFCELAPGTCQLCGNGILEGTEQCDDGNTNPFDGCDTCIIVDTTPD